MTRLPKPGSDKGTWGVILNDYLSVTHASDGTIKSASITESQLVPTVQSKLNVVSLSGNTLTGVVVEQNGTYAARPTGFANVKFIGETDPAALAVNGDEWIKLT